MRLTRIHVPGPLATGAMRVLPAAAGAHVARVLRHVAGDVLHLFDGDGHESTAIITSVQRDQVTVQVGDTVPCATESPLALTLLQGVARGEKMDFILQKATELGVTRFVPLLAARSTVKLDASGIARRHAHWQGVVIAACEQSGRTRLPSLQPATALPAALASPGDAGTLPQGTAALKILLAPEPGTPSLPALLDAHADAMHSGGICLLVGPEGGLTGEECDLAVAAGYRRCRLGPRVLRTETAGLAALAVVQAMAGDWR